MCKICDKLKMNRQRADVPILVDRDGMGEVLMRTETDKKGRNTAVLQMFYMDAEYLRISQTDIGYCPFCGSALKQQPRSTGLYDKNNIEIFEGNLLYTKYRRICKVVWHSSPSHCGWDLVPFDNLEKRPPDPRDLWQSKNLEVIN